MTFEDWKDQLLQLSPDVRSRVAEMLAESVRSEMAARGSAEGKLRYDAYLRGELDACELDDALTELRRKILG